jgi:hypothetical protein
MLRTTSRAFARAVLRYPRAASLSHCPGQAGWEKCKTSPAKLRLKIFTMLNGGAKNAALRCRREETDEKGEKKIGCDNSDDRDDAKNGQIYVGN